MADIIVITIIVIIVALAIVHIIKKRKNNNCAGCPYAGSCSGKCEQKPDTK